VRKLASLVLTFTFAGISFSQQTQSEFPSLELLNRFMEWCKQNWEQCKEIRLRRISVEKECLERSQSLDAFRECMTRSREKLRQN
jgi:hypothetical protein